MPMQDIWARLTRFFKITGIVLIQRLQRSIISIKRSWFLSPATQPDSIINIFAHRTDLYSSRLFKPRPIKDTSHGLPLVIMVHGGGFIMNKPCMDDPLARYIADDCNSLVTNIDYRKAPLQPFPAGYEDVVESTLALLDKGDMFGMDRSKVVLCGSSAGGNLVLAASQDPRLEGKLLGVIALYPVANMLPTESEQMAKRPDPSVPDFLEGSWDTVLDIYAGTTDPETLKDPRLSPINFGSRDKLPKHIFILGCEHDMLCYEAKAMAEKLASVPKEEIKDGWRAGDVQWKLVKGQTHGFDHFPRKDAKEEEGRERAKTEIYKDIAQWLRSVFETA